MPYLAILKQGGGCDYTIECGLHIVDLMSDSYDEVEKELTDILLEEYFDVDFRYINLIHFDNEREFDLKKLELLRKQQENEIKEEKEYDLYLNLKRKYDNRNPS